MHLREGILDGCAFYPWRGASCLQVVYLSPVHWDSAGSFVLPNAASSGRET